MTDNETQAADDGPDGDSDLISSRTDRRQVDLRDREYAIYRCADCANVVLTMHECDGGMTCHDEPMKQITSCELDIRPPNIRQVLLDAFGLPKPGLDICLCVIDDGPLSTAELADRLDYDESTVRKYLNELVEFGLLQKSQLNREQGGYVNVYHSPDLAEMRTESLVAFYAWAGEAASLIEEANLTKESYRDNEPDSGLNEVFWNRFENDEQA
ncbi:MAG: helix-turn-helix domain-containing protein [Haloarcula sp.]